MTHFSKNARNAILIVDKDGILGDKLSQELAKRFVVVYVSQGRQNADKSENVIYSEYGNSVPVIPNGNYSYIFVVGNGLWTSGFISEFIKKAKRGKSQLLFIVGLINFASFHKSYKKSKDQGIVKIIIIGEIFDKDINLPFIETAISRGIIQVNGEGLSKVYPVFLEDAVSAVIDAAFKQGSLFYLFPKYAPSQISLARMIQKANPSVRTDFIRGSKKEREIRVPLNGKYLLPDNYFLEKRINELKIGDLPIINNAKKNSINSSPKRQNRRAFIYWFLMFLFFLIMLPLISSVSFSFLGFVSLGNVKTAIERGNLSDAQRSTNISKSFFNLAERSSALLLVEAKIIGQENRFAPIMKKISLGQYLALAASHGLEALSILSQVFTGKSSEPEVDFAKGLSLLKSAVVVFRESGLENDVPNEFYAEVKNAEGVVEIIENTIDVLPSIFGFDGKKTYLVLFQNNMELRPGGGFIGSYGLLTVDSGLIENFSIHDVYDADGQLKEHVEPPFAVRRYLAPVHWYLRDSNFDVDFVKSAQSAVLLLNKETGERVDGVIAVDVAFVKNVLEAIGDVYVIDYKETVTADSLYEITQSHAEKDFFPGSRQKKNFLRSLFDSMQMRLISGENIPYLALVENVSRSLSEKHLLLAFNDNNIQDIFTTSGWSSAIMGILVSAEPNAINDFLGISEANLGVNKANFFVERKLFHNIDISEDGEISESIRIEYQNSSNGWPGGEYVNYLRVILPLNTVLSSISVDGVTQQMVSAVTDFRAYESEVFVEPEGLEIENYNQDGKTIYGFLMNVAPGKTKEVEIKYALSQRIPQGAANFTYNLNVFKQPGTDTYPYSISIDHPKSLKIVNGLSSGELGVDTDKELSIGFSKR